MYEPKTSSRKAKNHSFILQCGNSSSIFTEYQYLFLVVVIISESKVLTSRNFLFPRDCSVFKYIYMVEKVLVCHLQKYRQMDDFFDPTKTVTERKGCKIQGVASSFSELSCGLFILLLPRIHAKSLRLTTFYYLCFCYSTLVLRQVGKLCLKLSLNSGLLDCASLMNIGCVPLLCAAVWTLAY